MAFARLRFLKRGTSVYRLKMGIGCCKDSEGYVRQVDSASTTSTMRCPPAHGDHDRSATTGTDKKQTGSHSGSFCKWRRSRQPRSRRQKQAALSNISRGARASCRAVLRFHRRLAARLKRLKRRYGKRGRYALLSKQGSGAPSQIMSQPPAGNAPSFPDTTPLNTRSLYAANYTPLYPLAHAQTYDESFSGKNVAVFGNDRDVRRNSTSTLSRFPFRVPASQPDIFKDPHSIPRLSHSGTCGYAVQRRGQRQSQGRQRGVMYQHQHQHQQQDTAFQRAPIPPELSDGANSGHQRLACGSADCKSETLEAAKNQRSFSSSFFPTAHGAATASSENPPFPDPSLLSDM